MSTWSSDTLKVDCAGHYKLCYAIGAGDKDTPGADVCTAARTCVEVDYLEPGVETKLPDLPGWYSNDAACASRIAEGGGWTEMTVLGQSYACDVVDDGHGQPYVFAKTGICPLKCTDPAHQNDAGCSTCVNGAMQMF
jgi:hypothetical protein